MEQHPELWRGRRVLVTGCTGFLGRTVTRELLARGAIVAGLVRERRRAVEFSQEISEGRFHVVHGYVEDAIRLHTAMALHEVSAVFHLATADAQGNDRGTAAVRRAAILYHSKVPVIVAAPTDAVFEKVASNVQEVSARGGRVILFSDAKGVKKIGKRAETAITLPDCDPFVAPILYAIPVQLLAYHAAVAKGTDVDQPRNLAKAVTVE